MKTILVPTDFSKASDNAIEYAVEIAKATHAGLILFHAYRVPIIATEAVVVIPATGDIEQYALHNLKETKRKIQLQHRIGLEIECICKCGFAVEEINFYTNEHAIDFIVMGMHGAGYLTEKLIGSVTTSLIRDSNCPVMAIDQHVKFRTIKKIVLACDYKKIRKPLLWTLKDIAQLFDSHIYILNIMNEAELVLNDSQSASCGSALEHAFSRVEHSFHYKTNEDVVDGINEYVINEQMDMVVMIPRKHSGLETLFHEPNTKRMAFHTHVPVLALHEQHEE